MSQSSCNCIICANEFNAGDIHSAALDKINITNFKVCQACLDASDPTEDYRQVRNIVYEYLKFAQVKSLFMEAKGILDSRN
jgi:polyferredoxin